MCRQAPRRCWLCPECANAGHACITTLSLQGSKQRAEGGPVCSVTLPLQHAEAKQSFVLFMLCEGKQRIHEVTGGPRPGQGAGPAACSAWPSVSHRMWCMPCALVLPQATAPKEFVVPCVRSGAAGPPAVLLQLQARVLAVVHKTARSADHCSAQHAAPCGWRWHLSGRPLHNDNQARQRVASQVLGGRQQRACTTVAPARFQLAALHGTRAVVLGSMFGRAGAAAPPRTAECRR
jgi:hypothetical protein